MTQTVGFIGSGAIGSTLARLALAAGLDCRSEQLPWPRHACRASCRTRRSYPCRRVPKRRLEQAIQW
jgi:hypothetical protein